MRKIFFLIVLCALPSLAQAVGGACPTSPNYLTVTGSLTTLAALGVTNCYYIAANGSDLNDGLSEAAGHPWAHAPQMPNCSGNCATVQNATVQPGTGFIFRGGDSWHFGNPSATPFTGGTLNFNSGRFPNGAAGSPIYYGVDKGWFSGALWVRPILTADNPTETALTGCGLTVNGTSCLNLFVGPPGSLNACSFQIPGVNDFVELSNRKYIIIDNFEMTGLCSQGAAGPPGCVAGNTCQPPNGDTYFSYNAIAGPIGYYNLYIHGWTHVQIPNINSANFCTAGAYCSNVFIFTGGVPNINVPGETIQYTVVDGSDSDPRAVNRTCYCGFYSVSHSVFLNTSQIIPRDNEVYHDNIQDFFVDNGHANVFEESGNFGFAPIHALYNNVWRRTNAPSWQVSSTVGWWLGPNVGQNYYLFNNIFYDIGQLEYINVGSPSSAEGVQTWFNNTLQTGNYDSTGISGSIFQNAHENPTTALVVVNDHLITDNPVFQAGGAVTNANLTNTNSVANAAGYTDAQNFAFSPIASNSPTVGQGVNHTDYCNTLLASSDPLIQAAGTACKSDTTYGPVYNTTTHTVTGSVRTPAARPASGAWDVGAYQFGASLPTVATPTFSPIAGSYSSSQTVTISSTTAGSSFTYCQDTTNVCTPSTSGSSVVVNGTGYLRAQATHAGFNPSAIASAFYQIGNWSVVQHVKFASAPACNGSSSCSITIALTGAGHILNIGVATAENTNAAFSSITDNQNETWITCSLCATQFTGSDGLFYKNFDGYLLSSTAGVTTVTVTAAAPVAVWSMDFVELALASGTPSFDNAGSTTSASCTSCSGLSLTLTGTVDAVLQEGNPFHAMTAITGGTGYSGFQDFDYNGVGYAASLSTNTTAATWTQTSAAPAAMSTIAFSSTGGAGTPVVSLSPTGFTFSTNKNTNSAVQTATLQNIGNVNLLVSGDSTTTMFTDTETGSCPVAPYTLTSGQFCTYAITFTPNATGSFSGFLSVIDNAAGSPHTVALSGTGTAPTASWAPTSYAFGNVSVSSPVTSPAQVLSNTGNGPMAVNLTYGDTHFTTSSTTCGTTLVAGGQCNVQVTFTPTTTTSYSANLTETDNGQGIVQSLALTGTGVPVQVATPTFNPPAGSYTYPLPVTINDSTTGAAICFRTDGGTPTTSVAGTCAGAPTQTYSSPVSVNAFETLTAIGTLSGSADSAVGSATYISPAVSLVPTIITFSTNMNTTSSAQIATLNNTGTLPVVVSNVVVTGNFTNANTGLTGQCVGTSFTLAVGASCTINLTFSPTATISYSGNLSVTDNAVGSPQTVSLSGQGTQATIVWLSSQGGTTYGFGNALIGIPTSSAPQTLQNTGTGPLNINVTVTGTNATQFNTPLPSTTCSNPLPAGQSCTFTVTFNPAATSSYTAFLTETDSLASNSPQNLTLNGTGVNSLPIVAPSITIILGGRK